MKMTKQEAKYLIVLTLLLAMFGCSNLYAQPQLLWEQRIGTDDYDAMGDVAFCSNGNLLFTSRLQSDEMMLDCVAQDGTPLWSTLTTSNSGRDLERIGSIRFASTYTYGLDNSTIAVFNISSGLEYITETINGASEGIHTYLNGGYLVSGSISFNNPYVCRITSSGSIVWYAHVGGSQASFCNDIASGITNIIYAPVTSNDIIIYKISPSGSVIDSTIVQRINNSSVHSTLNIIQQPDGNLLMSGWFSMEFDSTYSGLTISPDGDILNYWGHQDMLLPYHSLYSMPDGGSVSIVPDVDSDNEILFTRYDATGTPIIDWSYDMNVDDYIYSSENQTVVVNALGEIFLFSDYNFFNIRINDDDTNVLAAKFGVWHTDLEIAANRYNNQDLQAPGRFHWHGTLTNNTDADITTDVWVIVRGPDGYPSEPLRVWEDITIPANGVYEADLQQNVPADAASGEYNYIVRAGTYDPDNPQHTIQAYFPLIVTGGTEVDLDPPRTRGVVAAPFVGPVLVELSPELKTTD